MRMSWDVKALWVLAGIWAAIAVLYVAVIQMAPGARAWTAGAIVFAFLAWAVLRAERRGAGTPGRI